MEADFTIRDSGRTKRRTVLPPPISLLALTATEMPRHSTKGHLEHLLACGLA
jgi:hypothetical protein